VNRNGFPGQSNLFQDQGSGRFSALNETRSLVHDRDSGMLFGVNLKKALRDSRLCRRFIGMKRFFRYFTGAVVLAMLAFVGGSFFYGSRTVHDLLAGNEKLKEALSSLTQEDQIGFAKVVKQEQREGKLYTTIRFVETDRDDMLCRLLEREYEIEGDIVHFDALIVTFEDQAVMDGQARSLYLWRRIYGENQPPAEGFDIESPDTIPVRYAGLLQALRLPDQHMFWDAVWDLANNPEALREHGIKAVYGNAVYKRLRPGLIYVFKIGADGQVYPETVLDM
jgi:hypothetical protein